MNKLRQAYEAYWRLNDNYEGWPIKGLDVSIMAVNPKTRMVDDDRRKNTHIEYWLETGPYHEEKDYHGFSHDYLLDCGGDSFEEAIIKLEKLVIRHYGKRTDIKGRRRKK